MHRFSFIVVVTCCFLAPFAVAEDTGNVERLPVISSVRLADAPEIDGRIGEEEWASAAQISSFASLDGEPAGSDTEAWLAHAGDTLYIGFKCSTGDAGSLAATAEEHDGDVWKDDSVEVFVDANRDYRSYHHFLVNSANMQRDESGDATQTPPFDVEWGGRWQSATDVADDSWSAELAIPLATVGIALQSKDCAIGINLARNDSATGETTAWSPYEPSLHQPTQFGSLILVDKAETSSFKIGVENAASLAPGKSTAVIRIETSREASTRLHWSSTVAKRIGIVWSRTGIVDVAADEAQYVKLPYSIDEEGVNTATFTVMNPSKGRLLLLESYVYEGSPEPHM